MSVMRKQMSPLIKFLLLLALSFFLMTSCQHSATQTPYQSLSSASECRVVQHKRGKTCIPVSPQRIVAIDASVIPDSLLALGIKPTAMTFVPHMGRKLFHGLSADELEGVQIVGSTGQPSLEKVLELKPDLIILNELSERNYQQISAIAPTVMIETDELKYSIKENLQSVAKVLNQQKRAEEVLHQYQKQADAVRQLLGKQLEEVEISILIYNGGFYKPASSNAFFQVLNDIGAKIKPILLEENIWLPVSFEELDRYDADILFIIDVDLKPLSYFFQNPLMSSLKAVRNNRVYVIDTSISNPYGLLGAIKLLDELPKYLIKGT